DAFACRKVGDGSGDAEDAVEAAGGEAHCFGGLGEEAAAGIVGGGDFVQEVAVCLGVGSDGVGGVAAGLDFAGGADALADFGGAFGGRREDEIGGGDGLDVYMEVYAVEHWAGDLGLVIGGAARGAGAG